MDSKGGRATRSPDLGVLMGWLVLVHQPWMDNRSLGEARRGLVVTLQGRETNPCTLKVVGRESTCSGLSV